MMVLFSGYAFFSRCLVLLSKNGISGYNTIHMFGFELDKLG